MKTLAFATALFVAIATIATPSQSQQAVANIAGKSEWQLRQEANEGVIRIISGQIHSTAFRATAEMASVMSDVEGMRLLAMMGKGSVQNVSDMLYLKGVDLAIVQEDVLNHMRDKRIHGALDRRINYIAKLYNEEVHLLAGGSVASVEELAGKKVAFGLETDGTAVTAEILFEQLGVGVVPVYMQPDVALQMVKSGELAAMVYVEGKPADLFRRVRKEDGLKFLPVPLTDAVQKASYLPTRLTAEDYPRIVPADGDGAVQTVAVGSVLMSFNWKPDTSRYKSIELFISTLFERLGRLQAAPYHPKWADVNLAAQVPGWERLPAVDAVLATTATADAQSCSEPALRLAMQKFLGEVSIVPTAGKLSREQTEQLVQDFKRWLDSQSR
jgi:TRAP transporter TAXI family solute receptor